jgi:hypothetical protein
MGLEDCGPEPEREVRLDPTVETLPNCLSLTSSVHCEPAEC